MLLNFKTENFISLNKSFLTAQDFVSGDFSVETGVCFSHLSGNALSISGDFSSLEQDIYLGISKQLNDLNATGIDIFNSSEREQKKDSEGAFWTWIELVNDEGQVLGLNSDIPLDSGASFQGPFNAFAPANAAFESYENGSILRLSYKETNEFDSKYVSETFQETNDDQVLFRDDDQSDNTKFEHFLVHLDTYETGVGRTAIGIVNFDNKLLIRL